jgi:RNA polymerase sigma factor (sigma-70 family)
LIDAPKESRRAVSDAAAQSDSRSVRAIDRLVSDGRLARRAVEGDEHAFATIFRRYHQKLYRYCLAIVGNPEDAQDALQNTMVKVLRALPGEDRKVELKPWLYRIAHNESIELLRRRRESRPLDTELPAAGIGLAHEAESRERLRHLISDLDELPERQRAALVMRELSGLDFAEIGTALGTSPAVARQTLYEARLSLRQMDEGREMSCRTVMKVVSDGDGRVTRRRDIRAHLRTCADCRRFRDAIGSRQRALGALAPLPAAAAAGILHGLLGSGSSAGGGLASALGGGAAKSIGASTLLKGAATVAVVGAIGVGAADRGGLIHLGLPGGGEAQPSQTQGLTAGEGPAVHEIRAPGPAAAGQGSASAPGSARPRAAQNAGGIDKAADPIDKVDTETAIPTTSTPLLEPHAQGRDHEKQLPSAAAHGQQTAATHKSTNHGSSEAKSHPAHPSKPPHPAKPSKPDPEKAASSPPSGAPKPEPPSQAPGTEQGAAPEGASPGQESTGRKPETSQPDMP